jgi:hypothetical protein
MSTRTKKKSNTKPFYINKKSAKIKMKKRYNKGGVIGVIYKPPIINKLRTTIKELTPSPLRKVKNTLAKSRIARTLKKKIIMYKQVKLSKLLIDDPTCLICFDDMKDIKDITLTSCEHIYHTSCIEKWLSNAQSKNKCPKCRAIIRKTSSTSASGLTLVQIEQLRTETQNIEATMHEELIKKLCTCQKCLWILKEKINWVNNNWVTTNWQIIFATYFESDMQEMSEWMNSLETLINKIIAIYSDVFPDYKHLFQDINNSNVLPFSMTLETIERDLQNIYEDDEALKADLKFLIDTVMDAKNEITDDIYLAPFMTTAEIMVNSNNPLTS